MQFFHSDRFAYERPLDFTDSHSTTRIQRKARRKHKHTCTQTYDDALNLNIRVSKSI